MHVYFGKNYFGTVPKEDANTDSSHIHFYFGISILIDKDLLTNGKDMGVYCTSTYIL